MKATIFNQLSDMYSLKKPSKRYILAEQYQKAQQLAILFYAYVLKYIVKVQPPQTKNITEKQYQKLIELSQKTLKFQLLESYRCLFASFKQKKNQMIEYIGSLISLLSQFIFLAALQEQNNKSKTQVQKLTNFHEYLQQQKLDLKEKMFILFTDLTINRVISKQSASIIIGKYIKGQNMKNTNFGVKIKLDENIKCVEQSMKNINYVGQNRKTKQKKHRLHGNSYITEFKSLLRQNQQQIKREQKMFKIYQRRQLQSRQNKKKIKCITEPCTTQRVIKSQQIDKELIISLLGLAKKEKPKKVSKWAQEKQNNRVEKKRINHNNHKSVNFWQDYVKVLKKDQQHSIHVIQRSSLNKSNFLPTIQSVPTTLRKSKKSMEIPSTNCSKIIEAKHIDHSLLGQSQVIQNKFTLQNNTIKNDHRSSLPYGFITPYHQICRKIDKKQEDNYHLNMKNPRKLKKQLNKFIYQRSLIENKY